MVSRNDSISKLNLKQTTRKVINPYTGTTMNERNSSFANRILEKNIWFRYFRNQIWFKKFAALQKFDPLFTLWYQEVHLK